MESPAAIPSNELTVNGKSEDVEKLRPTSDTPLESTATELIIEYTPKDQIPVKEVKLVSTDNIKSYTVKFFNADGSVTERKVEIFVNLLSASVMNCDLYNTDKIYDQDLNIEEICVMNFYTLYDWFLLVFVFILNIPIVHFLTVEFWY